MLAQTMKSYHIMWGGGGGVDDIVLVSVHILERKIKRRERERDRNTQKEIQRERVSERDTERGGERVGGRDHLYYPWSWRGHSIHLGSG